MKIAKGLIIIVIIAVISAMLVPYLKPQDDSKYVGMQSKIDSLQSLNDTIRSQRAYLELSEISLKKQIAEQPEKIIYINKQQNEANIIINRFNNKQLYDFFTNRSYTKADSTLRR